MLLISSNDIKIDHTKVAGYGREDREYDSQYLNLSRPKKLVLEYKKKSHKLN